MVIGVCLHSISYTFCLLSLSLLSPLALNNRRQMHMASDTTIASVSEKDFDKDIQRKGEERKQWNKVKRAPVSLEDMRKVVFVGEKRNAQGGRLIVLV